MPAEAYAYHTDNLTIGYKSKHGIKTICRNIALSANKGELIALVGENGAGKSTLLNALAGLSKPLSGDIFVHGKSIHQISLKKLSQLIGYVSTEQVKVFNLTVYDLVALGRIPHTNWLGAIEDEDRQVIDESLRSVGMLAFAQREVVSLSDGERQRALIARTLAQDTPFMLLDEPTAFLDLPNKYEIVHLLSNLARRHQKTIIFSTHDLSVALQNADKIWIITQGNAIEGAPEDLMLNRSLDRLFPHSNLTFDAGSYQFIEKISKKPIINFFAEDKELSHALRLMLERKAYKAIQSKTADAEITATRTANLISIVWHKNGETFTFSSIYQLAQQLPNGYTLK
jgi:iron complex transport system ATP-binding protein